MADLSTDDVLKLAALARLQLSDDEIKALKKDLAEILTYVEQLQSVDTTNLPPTNQVTGLTNVMREDELIDYGYKPADLLRNVPATEQGLIRVKRMIG